MRIWKTPILVTIFCLLSACSSQGKERHKDAANIASTASGVTKSSPYIYPAGLNRVILFNRDHWIVADGRRVLMTKDGGRTWTITYTVGALKESSVAIRGLSFIDTKTGFLISGGPRGGARLLRTDDAGMSWGELGGIKSEGLDITYNNCYFIDAKYGWAVGLLWSKNWSEEHSKVAAYVGVVVATKDGGRTWQTQQVAMPSGRLLDDTRWSLRDVFFVDTKTGWAVGDVGSVFRTDDGGEKWHIADAGDVDYQNVSFIDKQFGWMSYSYGNGPWGVATTSDGGRRWRLLDESIAYGTWPVNAIFLTPNHGFAACLKLFETKDGGRHWEARDDVDGAGEREQLFLGRAQDGTLILLSLSKGSVSSLLSLDGGATWRTD